MTYRHDYAAFGAEVLNAEWMVAAMRAKAEQVAAAAKADALTYADTGQFAESISVESGTHGGIHGDRAYGRVSASDPAALSIEFGTADTPAHYSITRALDAIR